MAVREIMIHPYHQVELRLKSDSATGVTRHVKRLIRDLKDTLRASSDGIGLAAPQINVHLRVVVVCLENESTGERKVGLPEALINPVIMEAGDERKDFDGCLSFPGLYGETIRPHHLRVTGLNEDGQTFDRVFDGFNAVVVHHEIDHLNGVLFIDRIEKPEDLYRLSVNEDGEFVRLQASNDQKFDGNSKEAVINNAQISSNI